MTADDYMERLRSYKRGEIVVEEHALRQSIAPGFQKETIFHTFSSGEDSKNIFYLKITWKILKIPAKNGARSPRDIETDSTLNGMVWYRYSYAPTLYIIFL